MAAISETEEVSLSTLAERLKLAKTTISWRTSRAIRGGWLVNNETRKGQPARFARGTPLPDEVSALPTPEALMSPYERPTRFREGAEPLPSQPGNVVSLHRVSDSSLAATDTDDDLDEWVTI